MNDYSLCPSRILWHQVFDRSSWKPGAGFTRFSPLQHFSQRLLQLWAHALISVQYEHLVLKTRSKTHALHVLERCVHSLIWIWKKLAFILSQPDLTGFLLDYQKEKKKNQLKNCLLLGLEHISPVLRLLYWLPEDKLYGSVTGLYLNHLAPKYTSDLLAQYVPAGPLWSSRSGL